MVPSPRTAILLLAGVIVVWGLNWPVMKLGVDVMQPIGFVAVRMALAALCLFAVVGALGRLKLPRGREWGIVVLVAVCQMGGFLALVTTALQFVEASRSAILSYTMPLWVIPFAVLFLGEKLTGLRLAGSVVGLLGVAVMFNPIGFDWSDGPALIGNGLLMLAALLWAVQILVLKHLRWSGSALDLSPWQTLVATLGVTPLALLLEGGLPLDWSWLSAGVLIYNGVLASAFCFVAAVAISQALPAITTSLALLAVPVAGLLFSAMLLGEPVTLTLGLGLGLIIAGLALVALGERRAAVVP